MQPFHRHHKDNNNDDGNRRRNNKGNDGDDNNNGNGNHNNRNNNNASNNSSRFVGCLATLLCAAIRLATRCSPTARVPCRQPPKPQRGNASTRRPRAVPFGQLPMPLQG